MNRKTTGIYAATCAPVEGMRIFSMQRIVAIAMLVAGVAVSGCTGSYAADDGNWAAQSFEAGGRGGDSGGGGGGSCGG